jgi:hypothetical protein
MPKKLKKTHDTTIFSFSHSSLDVFSKCAFEWYLKYIELNYPEKNNPTTDFGNLCHEIGENYFGGGRAETKRLCKEYVKMPLAMARIEKFFEAKLANSPKVFREKEFRLALNPYIDVTGKIDVLYKDDDSWTVVDYKTSKKFGNYEKQFAFYYYLLSKYANKVPEKMKFQGVYLCAGNGTEIHDFVKETVLDKSCIELTEDRIEDCYNTILTKDIGDKSKWHKNPHILCDWCEYGPIRGNGICEGRHPKKEEING